MCIRDRKLKPAVFHEGDLVYYFNPRKFVGKSEKWSRKYTGPFRIIKELSAVTMLLQTHNKRRTFVAHVDKLKRSFENENEFPQVGNEAKTEEEDCSSKSDDFRSRPQRNSHPPRRLIEE